MKLKSVIILLAVTLLVVTFGCEKNESKKEKSVKQDSLNYSYTSPSFTGIGKKYMGREIAEVMEYSKAPWLERSERDSLERPDEVVKHMNLKKTDIVADIGAGTGYFTFRISSFVPEGKVYAVEIESRMLDIIEQRKVIWKKFNIEAVLGDSVSANLPENEIDVVLLVLTYKEFSNPKEMLESIKKSLVPGGRLILVEYRREDIFIPINELHKMTEVQIKKELDVAGFNWVRTEDFLPQQHFMVFEKP